MWVQLRVSRVGANGKHVRGPLETPMGALSSMIEGINYEPLECFFNICFFIFA
jgi:hypothetical protein